MREAEITDPASLAKAIAELEKQMEAAAKRLEFEDAAGLRDRIEELRAADLRGAANGRRAASEPATMRPASAKRRLRTLGMTAQAARSDTFGAATPAGRQRGDRGPTAG